MKIKFDQLNMKEQIFCVLSALILTFLAVFLLNLYLNNSLTQSKENLQRANELLTAVKSTIEFSSDIQNTTDQPEAFSNTVISTSSKRFNVIIDSIDSNDRDEVLVSINAVNFNDLYRWLRSLEMNSKIITVKASLRRNQPINKKQKSVRVQLVLISKR